jgi:hypothetical protein
VIDLSEKGTNEKDKSNKGVISKIKDVLPFGKDKGEDLQPSEKEVVGEVKSKQSLISKIQDVFLFGRGTREDLQEFDKQLREDYFKKISNHRQRWEEIYLEILDSQQPLLNRKSKTIIQTLDRIKEQVNRASYGYAPLFSRTGKIDSNELGRVFNYDKEFGEYLDRLGESEENVAKSVELKDWKAASDRVNNMKLVLDDTEKRWKEREKYFRSKEV